jgi:hypothetical protein
VVTSALEAPCDYEENSLGAASDAEVVIIFANGLRRCELGLFACGSDCNWRR